MVEIVEVQVGSAEANTGEHWIVLAKHSVGGDVDQTAVCTGGAQCFVASFCAYHQSRTLQGAGDGMHFVLNKRRARIWYAEDKRRTGSTRFFLMTKRVDTGAGRIGN